MDLPKIEGYTLRAVVGTGSCGTVYLAERDDGGLCAVKLLASLAINRDVLSYCFGRIGAAVRPSTILDVFEYDVVGSPQFISMPFLGELDEQGQPVPASLASLCGAITEKQAWEILARIASGMAFLHREGVVHCSLKPSNVFYLMEGGRLEPRIADISLGWLGGVHRMDLDALLPHLAPEQVRAPGDVFEGAGLRWDVYAFGVLAYQLITGRLPRVADYVEAARRRQDPQGVGLPFVVDVEDFSRSLQEEATIHWPTQAESQGDARRRKVIERCLRIDPRKRWVDLRDIEREFLTIEQERVAARLESKAKHERARQRNKLVRTRIFSTAALGAVITAAWLGSRRTDELEVARQERVSVEGELRARVAESEERLKRLRGELNEAKSAREEALQGFMNSRNQTDGLLEALLDANGRSGEVLEGGQLESALKFYEERVASNRSGKISEASIRDVYNLALLRGRVGDTDGALRALRHVQQQVVDLSRGSVENKALRESLVRAARAASEEHGMLLESGKHSGLVDALQRSRSFYAALVGGDAPDAELLLEAATVSLQLGRQFRQVGRHETAMEALVEAFDLLGKAVDKPINDPGGFGLVARQSRHESGLVRRLQGQRSAAVALQLEVVEGSLPHVESGLASFEDKRLLALAYTELAEMVSVMAGPQDGLEAHGQAVAILKDLLVERPHDVQSRYAMARNYGELAAYDRDVGSKDESLRKQQIGVAILEQLLEEVRDESALSRFVRLEYAEQKIALAELLGEANQSKDAVVAGELALAVLEKLLDEPSVSEGGRIDEVRKRAGFAMARVLGSLGHNHEKLKDTASARKFFTRAIDGWKALADTSQKGGMASAEEVDRGLAWSEDRLARLRR